MPWQSRTGSPPAAALLISQNGVAPALCQAICETAHGEPANSLRPRKSRPAASAEMFRSASRREDRVRAVRRVSADPKLEKIRSAERTRQLSFAPESARTPNDL